MASVVKRVKYRITRLKGMIKSCYAYDSLHPDNPYLKEYREELGTIIYNAVYEEQVKYLTENFTIERGTYTDSEGCTYNRLEPIVN